MPSDVLTRLHPSLHATFIPIDAPVELHLPGDAGAVFRDILRASLTPIQPTPIEAQPTYADERA